ncbi:MAG TPA: hypothetical protein VMW91_01535 [Desulfosporosinus sp.]|nr:hypothetical protein [Desulfosporosinus sp.]
MNEMNANELHVHQSFKEWFFGVGLMVLFAISFHSLACLRRGYTTRQGYIVSLLRKHAKRISVDERKQSPIAYTTVPHPGATQARGSFLA